MHFEYIADAVSQGLMQVQITVHLQCVVKAFVAIELLRADSSDANTQVASAQPAKLDMLARAYTC